MSSPLAIAGVTAALKDLLNDGLLNHDLSSVGSFAVTALPPDRVTVGENEPNQLNLFLYQVTPNVAIFLLVSFEDDNILTALLFRLWSRFQLLPFGK